MDLITLALSKKFISDAIDEAKVDKTDMVQSDWNQNDENAIDYIKNRPFGATGKYIETTFGENLSFELKYPSVYMAPKDTLSNHSLVTGAKYKIVIDGEEYIRFAQNNNSRVFLGNEKNDYITVLMGNADWSTGDPFYYEDGILTVKTSNPTCNVSLYELKEEILLLDKKYINYIAGENIEGKKVSYENEDYICGSGAEVFNDIMSNIAIGKYSHAEGDSTKAIGIASHAEGYNTKATEEYSHAEGFGATAKKWAHAEGYSTDANGTASHAEGYMTKTASVGSHAEGKNTEALGSNSHAEGEYTKAIGYSQHVQGKYNIPDTSAAYVSASMSQGSYPYQDGETIVYLCPEKPILNAEEGYYTLNQKCIPVAIKDITADSNILYSEPQNNIIQGYFIFRALIDTKISDGITYYQWKYSEIYCELNSEGFGTKLAHIVGNGTNEDNRSNAHTLDWEGNAWYQGDIYVGSTSGTNKDEGSKKLATEEYVNTEVANLVNSAPETLDTLGELATALEENSDIVEVLNSAIANKADKEHTHSWNDLEDKPFGSEIVNEPIEITWDGDKTDKIDIVEWSGFGNCYLGDYGITHYDQLLGGTVKIGENTYTLDSYDEWGDVGYRIRSSEHSYAQVIIITEQNEEYPIGVYAYYSRDTYVSYIKTNSFERETINKLDAKYLPENIQSDWNQNDENAIDYIKNRPFYEGEPVENIVLPEIVVEDTSSLEDGMWTLAAVRIEVGETYEVLYNDEIYTVECYEGDIGPSIGDVNTQEYPFYMFDGGWATMLKFIPQTEPLKFCIKSYTSPIKKLERKFIEGIVGKDVEGKVFEYDGKQYTAQRYAEIFNDHDNVAVGYASHAEGYATKALGTDSHAEGYGTVTKGQASHAEGSYTIASGAGSHSEGSRTIASSDYQHVQGKYNIEDTEGKYAHIVGNGENTHNEGEKRSNAHTLDWEGNAEFAGDVKVNACGGENPISLIALAEEVAKLKELMSNGSAGQFAVSDGNGGINWITLCKAEEVEY